jgi:hypothetical protein
MINTKTRPCVYEALSDGALSFEARAAHLLLCNLPDNEPPTPETLMVLAGFGKTLAYRIFRELRQSGRVVLVQHRAGREVTGVTYHVFRSIDEAVAAFPGQADVVAAGGICRG